MKREGTGRRRRGKEEEEGVRREGAERRRGKEGEEGAGRRRG